VQIKVDRGGVTAYCGAMDIGQGSDSVLATIVAEELGLQPPTSVWSPPTRTRRRSTSVLLVARDLHGRQRGAGGGAKDARDAGRSGGGKRRKYEDVSFEEASILGEARFGTLTSAGSYTPPKLAGPYKGSGVGPARPTATPPRRRPRRGRTHWSDPRQQDLDRP